MLRDLFMIHEIILVCNVNNTYTIYIGQSTAHKKPHDTISGLLLSDRFFIHHAAEKREKE